MNAANAAHVYFYEASADTGTTAQTKSTFNEYGMHKGYFSDFNVPFASHVTHQPFQAFVNLCTGELAYTDKTFDYFNYDLILGLAQDIDANYVFN